VVLLNQPVPWVAGASGGSAIVYDTLPLAGAAIGKGDLAAVGLGLEEQAAAAGAVLRGGGGPKVSVTAVWLPFSSLAKSERVSLPNASMTASNCPHHQRCWWLRGSPPLCRWYGPSHSTWPRLLGRRQPPLI
jgi:hypothetical protein